MQMNYRKNNAIKVCYRYLVANYLEVHTSTTNDVESILIECLIEFVDNVDDIKPLLACKLVIKNKLTQSRFQFVFMFVRK